MREWASHRASRCLQVAAEHELRRAWIRLQADCDAPRYVVRLPGYGIGGSLSLTINALWRT